jgi:hypothetical protein
MNALHSIVVSWLGERQQSQGQQEPEEEGVSGENSRGPFWWA